MATHDSCGERYHDARKGSDKIVKGARVTGQPTHWYTGELIQGWPNPQYMGTVMRVFVCGGIPTARVKLDTGRKELESVKDLYFVA